MPMAAGWLLTSEGNTYEEAASGDAVAAAPAPDQLHPEALHRASDDTTDVTMKCHI